MEGINSRFRARIGYSRYSRRRSRQGTLCEEAPCALYIARTELATSCLVLYFLRSTSLYLKRVYFEHVRRYPSPLRFVKAAHVEILSLKHPTLRLTGHPQLHVILFLYLVPLIYAIDFVPPRCGRQETWDACKTRDKWAEGSYMYDGYSTVHHVRILLLSAVAYAAHGRAVWYNRAYTEWFFYVVPSPLPLAQCQLDALQDALLPPRRDNMILPKRKFLVRFGPFLLNSNTQPTDNSCVT